MIVKFSVAIESHPAAFVVVNVYVPGIVYSIPFQLYGNWLGQTVTSLVDVVGSLIVKISVATESHPVALVVVNLYNPVALYSAPFQLYGNWFEQTVTLVVDVVGSLIVKFNVATESQPAALVVVNVYAPAVL